MTNQSVFEYLIAKHICFSVCVAVNEANNRAITANSKDYFILVKSSDIKPKVKNHWGFKCSNDYCTVLQRDLNACEVNDFKGMTDNFNKVIHTADGRVYEIKGESFKRHLETV